MTTVEIPRSIRRTGPPTSAVAAVLEERGTCRLSELRQQLAEDRLGPALLELVERGEVAVFPVGDTVQVKPVG